MLKTRLSEVTSAAATSVERSLDFSELQQKMEAELKKSNALDKVNLNRLILAIKTSLQETMTQYVFEQNDTATRNSLKESIESFLSGLTERKALTDYAVVCDETNNPPYTVDQGELRVDLAIKTRPGTEFVHLPARMIPAGVS